MKINIDVGNIEKVVAGGFCTGCGGCSYVTGNPMKINVYGEYQPDLEKFSLLEYSLKKQAEFVCPSLNPSYNEKVLSSSFLEQVDAKQSKYIGPYQDVYGGYVVEGNYRENGTSGGFGTWVGAALFEKGLIDGVIHLKETPRISATDPFFKYGISNDINQIIKGSKTKYHVVEVSEVLNLIKESPGCYLFIGLPCMIKTIRRIQLTDPSIKKSIKFTLALVCGHLKSINWTLSLAWAKGIHPVEADSFLYRTKAKNISARAYVFTAYSKNEEIREDSGNVVGGKFNQGALMLEACNFCDDVVGETADLTIGDAWLSQFEIDPNGTNLLIVRNKVINNLLKEALGDKKIHIVDLTEKDAIDAQSGGFRQRRDGLSYRLNKHDKKGLWRPVKRIEANSFNLPPLRKLIFKMRYEITVKSRIYFKEALEKNDYEWYKNKLRVQLKILRILEITSSAPRIIRKKVASSKLKYLK